MDEISGGEIELIGVDCAVDPRRVGLSRARYAGKFVGRIETRRSRELTELVDWIADRLSRSERTLVAIDSPLGWPAPLGEALVEHMAGRPLGARSDALFRRQTDRVVRKRIGKQTLDVGADRIARTAVAALELLDGVRRAAGLEIALAWDRQPVGRATAIETYPAAWLLSQGLPANRYKDAGPEAVARRDVIIARLRELTGGALDAAGLSEVRASSHSLDSLICVFCAVDFLRGRCLAPEPAERELARREGWIWFPL